MCVDDLETSVRRVVAAGGKIIVAPLDARPAGRLAIVEGPAGASFGLWEPCDRSGAQRINEPRAWAMSTLRTRDLPGEQSFYKAVFGWNAERSRAELCFDYRATLVVLRSSRFRAMS